MDAMNQIMLNDFYYHKTDLQGSQQSSVTAMSKLNELNWQYSIIEKKGVMGTGGEESQPINDLDSIIISLQDKDPKGTKKFFLPSM